MTLFIITLDLLEVGALVTKNNITCRSNVYPESKQQIPVQALAITQLPLTDSMLQIRSRLTKMTAAISYPPSPFVLTSDE